MKEIRYIQAFKDSPNVLHITMPLRLNVIQTINIRSHPERKKERKVHSEEQHQVKKIEISPSAAIKIILPGRQSPLIRLIDISIFYT